MNILGIDIAKKKVDVYLLLDQQSQQNVFSNDPDGFNQLHQ